MYAYRRQRPHEPRRNEALPRVSAGLSGWSPGTVSMEVSGAGERQHDGMDRSASPPPRPS